MRKQTQQGLTMIEILIAIFVMAVGLLGTATLQMRAVQDTGNANLRSVATYQAYDLADRIRANKAAVVAGHWDDLDSAAADADCLTTTGCTVQEMALNDQYEWLENLETLLPDGTGEIERNGNLFTVTVSWTERVKQGSVADDESTEVDESKAASGSAETTVSLTFEP